MRTVVFGESLRDAHGYIRAKGMPGETTVPAFDCRALRGIEEKVRVLLVGRYQLNHYWQEFKARLEELEGLNLVQVQFKEDW